MLIRKTKTENASWDFHMQQTKKKKKRLRQANEDKIC